MLDNFLFVWYSIYNQITVQMKNKEIIRIINEEISDFDFLGNDQYMKEKEFLELLRNEEFQKQFICDSLLKKREKIKVESFDNTVSEVGDNTNNINIQIDLNIEYLYDQTKEPVPFSLGFIGNGVAINVDSNYDPGNWGNSNDDAVAPSGSDWIDYVNWNDIDCKFYTSDGDEIDFIAFKKAPVRIQSMFVREYCENGIEKGSGISVQEKRPDKIQNVPYC